jgi:hypothetical protein
MKRFFAVLLLLALVGVLAPFLSVAKPHDGVTKEETLQHLRQGDILTDGGSLDKGVWATMEGVVDAPPEVVWQLFIRANDWNGYKLPDMIDCRAVDEPILNEARNKKKPADFYKILGNRVIDPLAPRAPYAEWTNYTFQYFNMPWPVSDRWYIIQNFADETKSKEGIYKTRWESQAGNIRSVKGELLLEPFEGKAKTHLSYRAEVDLGSSIPRFLLKYGVKRSLPAAMRVIRRESVKLSQASP